jgi:hypothetical protein
MENKVFAGVDWPAKGDARSPPSPDRFRVKLKVVKRRAHRGGKQDFQQARVIDATPA